MTSPICRLLLSLLALTAVCLTNAKDTKIYNGNTAPVGRFPWIGSLLLRTGETHLCSVTVLSKRWLMTSAHCLPLQPSMYRVALGHGAPVFYHINSIIKHDEFTRNGSEFAHDIALLSTDSDIVLDVHIQPAKLPDHHVPTGMKCWAIGQGIRHDASANYLIVGTSELSDGPYVDEELTDMSYRYIMPDPLMTIPTNGTLTHLEIFVKIPSQRPDDYFYLERYRKLAEPWQYTWSSIVKVTPIAGGPQLVNITTPHSVVKGDTIGIEYYRGKHARIPFKERAGCGIASMNYSSPYGSGGIFSPIDKLPCREYSIRAYIKVDPSVSGLAPRLEQMQVVIQESSKETITVAGKRAAPCQGDDGGTLSCNCGEEATVYGIMSYSLGTCNADHTYAIYTQLYNYTEWIKEIITEVP